MNESFVYGFLFSVIVISGLLALQYGDDFNFLNDRGFTVLPSFGTALNWKSAISLSLLFGLFFRNLRGSISWRILNGLWILALGWAVMDLFWIIKACLCGNFLFGSEILSFINVRGIVFGLIRNLLMILISSLFAWDSLRISRSFLAGFGAIVAYWIFIIWSFPFSGYLFNTFIVYGVNFLPFVIALKSWSEKSWRNFLFA